MHPTPSGPSSRNTVIGHDLPTQRSPTPRSAATSRWHSVPSREVPQRAARRVAACRSRGARRRRPGLARGTSRSTSTASARAPRRRRRAGTRGDRRRRASVQPRADVPVGVHREGRRAGTRAGPPVTAATPRAAMARTWAAGRVQPRDVTLAPPRRPGDGRVVVLCRRRRCPWSARAARCSTSSRSGSKPSPMSRARNSGTSAPASSATDVGEADAGSSGCSSAIRSRNARPRSRATRPAPSRPAPTARRAPCGPGCRTSRCAGLDRTRPRRACRPGRTRSGRPSRRLLGRWRRGPARAAPRSSREPVSLHFTNATPYAEKSNTVTEAGDTTIRWNRSRCMPV